MCVESGAHCFYPEAILSLFDLSQSSTDDYKSSYWQRVVGIAKPAALWLAVQPEAEARTLGAAERARVGVRQAVAVERTARREASVGMRGGC